MLGPSAASAFLAGCSGVAEGLQELHASPAVWLRLWRGAGGRPVPSASVSVGAPGWSLPATAAVQCASGDNIAVTV